MVQAATLPGTSYRQGMAMLSLDALADQAASDPNGTVYHAAMVEFARRAAVAIQETAAATRRNARYMLWSVIVLTVASAANVIVTWLHH
jgi:hypothetical protein